MECDTDVLILGAGPVGMTLANELARRRIAFRIVDRAAGIREVSKAMILHVRTQEVLDKVGMAARARDEAQPLTEVVVHRLWQAYRRLGSRRYRQPVPPSADPRAEPYATSVLLDLLTEPRASRSTGIPRHRPVDVGRGAETVRPR